MENEFTSSEIMIVRMMRENARMQRAIAELRDALEVKKIENETLADRNRKQAEAIQHLSDRVNRAEVAK